jgi:MFS family permease
MKFSPRAAITLTFIAFGAVVGINVGSLAVLQKQAGITPLIFGYMAALGMLSNIIVMGLGGFINRHFDHRGVLLFILPIAFAGLVITLLAQSVWSFALAIVLFNLALGALDLFMNAEAAVVEHASSKPIFSSFHGAALFSIAIFGLIGSTISIWFGPLWGLIPPLPILALALYAIHQTIPHRPIAEHNENQKPVELPKKILIYIGIVLGLNVACELTCIQWSGRLLAELAPNLAAYSGLGVTFYGLCNGTMRLFADRLRGRFGDFNLMMASLVLAIIGLLILATTPGFMISVLAFAASGIGLASIFPCLFSITTKIVPEARATALAFVSAIGGTPRILLPIGLGMLAQSYGLNAIYGAAAAVAAVALGFIYLAAKETEVRASSHLPVSGI